MSIPEKTGIYQILNNIDGKCYIGQTKNFTKRLSSHRVKLRNNNHENPYLQNAWNKYGEENFSFNIIENFVPEKELDNKEIYYISFYNSFVDDGFGYNLTRGANLVEYSNFTKEKRKSAKNGRIGRKASEETKKKKSDAMKKIWAEDEEYRSKILNSLNGHPVSQETREKLRKAFTGRIISDEQRKFLSEINKGKPGFFKGKKHKDSTKDELSKKNILENQLRISEYYGIYFDAPRNKYRVVLTFMGKHHFMGRYADPIHAAQNADLGVLLHSPFDHETNMAIINFPDLLSEYEKILNSGEKRIKNKLEI